MIHTWVLGAPLDRTQITPSYGFSRCIVSLDPQKRPAVCSAGIIGTLREDKWDRRVCQVLDMLCLHCCDRDGIDHILHGAAATEIIDGLSEPL